MNTLRAAIAQADANEAARVAHDAEIAARLEAQALNNALRALRDQATLFDTKVGELVALSEEYVSAAERVYARHPHHDQVQRIERARANTLHILHYRLRRFIGTSGGFALSPEKDHLSFLVNHLPAVQDIKPVHG